MPTISGLRRRGFTPEAIRALMDEVGVTKMESMIDIGRLEAAVRADLNRRAPRRMGVLRPLKLIVENYPEAQEDRFEAQNNPEDPSAGSRSVPFSRELWIERDDFMEQPPKKFFRLAPGQEVRLRWAYIVRCVGVDKDAAGNITAVRCTYDPQTRGGDIPLGPDGKPVRKVQGTIHWVSARHAIAAEVRLFDRLFAAEEPGKATGNWGDDLNPHSLEVVRAWLEPDLVSARFGREENGCRVGDRFQLERLGYFCVDQDSAPAMGGSGPSTGLVLNRTVTLKDGWSKEAAKA